MTLTESAGDPYGTEPKPPTRKDTDHRIGWTPPATYEQKLACAAVLYRNGCRDLLVVLGLTDG